MFFTALANTDGDVPKSIEDAQNHHLNAEPKKTSGKNGHSHGGGGGSSSQMNMRGVFLHVMGDALGSVVVIISALIMWRTEWEYKFYVDPGIYTLDAIFRQIKSFIKVRLAFVFGCQTFLSADFSKFY